MYYGQLKAIDISNGPGIRVALFVSGCTNHCDKCFQPETWDFHYGQPFTPEVEDKVISLLAPSYIKGLSILGGDPFEPSNQIALLPFVRRVRATYPNKTIWAYTGFTFEMLMKYAPHPRCQATDELLSLIDVLVDGRFIENLKDLRLHFRGSSNQRLIDVPATMKSGHVVLTEI